MNIRKIRKHASYWATGFILMVVMTGIVMGIIGIAIMISILCTSFKLFMTSLGILLALTVLPWGFGLYLRN